MSVFRNLDCLSLVVCSNTTLLKLQTVLFLFFSKFCASKSRVRLIYGCGLYTDVYGTFNMNREGFTEDLKFNKQIKKHKNLVLLPNTLRKVKIPLYCNKVTNLMFQTFPLPSQSTYSSCLTLIDFDDTKFMCVTSHKCRTTVSLETKQIGPCLSLFQIF